MKRRSLIFLAVLLIAGCAEIKSSSRLTQPLGSPLIAGVGDAIVEIDTQESLPNIFGNADLYGRTRPTGRIFVTYLGLEQGRAVFERQTVRFQSNATTMNSSPIIIPQTSTTTYTGTTSITGGISGTAVSSGSATTTAPPIVLPPSGSKTQVISSDRIRYFLDLDKDRTLFVGGYEILIEEAITSSVKYRIKKLN